MRQRTGNKRGGATALWERRHQELLARYQALIERVATGKRTESAFHRLSWFALQRSSSALAMFRDGRVVMANARWHALASARQGVTGWTVRDGDQGAEYADLGTLGASELARLPYNGQPATVTVKRRNSQQVLRLRLERVAPPGEDAIGLVLADDVTEEAARDHAMEELREGMRKREQMAAMGRLAAGVAHDLGNTLNALALRVELLSRAVDARGRDHLREMNEAVAMMRQTLDHLGTFGGERPRAPHAVDVRAVLRSAAEVAGLALPSRRGVASEMVVDLRLPKRLPRAFGDSSDLTNVFVNLFLNARDAMDGRGTITVAVAVASDHLTVSVHDEGPGFAPDHLERAFEPFFTTKGARGSGLGLSLAYGVIDAVGGNIHARNHPDGGAEITIELPLAAARTKSASVPDVGGGVSGRLGLRRRNKRLQ